MSIHSLVATCMYTAITHRARCVPGYSYINPDSGMLRGSTWQERVKESELEYTLIKHNPVTKVNKFYHTPSYMHEWSN